MSFDTTVIQTIKSKSCVFSVSCDLTTMRGKVFRVSSVTSRVTRRRCVSCGSRMLFWAACPGGSIARHQGSMAQQRRGSGPGMFAETFLSRCRRISGLVAEYVAAIDVIRVRFPADALSLALCVKMGSGHRDSGARDIRQAIGAACNCINLPVATTLLRSSVRGRVMCLRGFVEPHEDGHRPIRNIFWNKRDKTSHTDMHPGLAVPALFSSLTALRDSEL